MANLLHFAPAESTDDDVYRRFANVLSAENDGQAPPTGLESMDVISQVVGLVGHGDHLALIEHDGDYNEIECYDLALKITLDAALQLELACAFLNRADPHESPLCEHQYTGQDFVHWEPAVEIHDRVGTGTPARDRNALVKLALAAYGHAWSFYTMRGRGFGRSLFCLDGMRVCYEELDSVDDLWTLCQGVSEWIFDSYNFKYGWLDRDFDAIVAEILSRFAKTEGRLEASFDGRTRAEKKLQRELGAVWDQLHLEARKHLVTAEYKQALLKDPDHDPWDYIDKYPLAIEAMLSNRIGTRLDAYIDGSDDALAKGFVSDYLTSQYKRWKASELTIDQWRKVLSDRRYTGLFPTVGLDHKYLLSGLASDLARVLPYRGPAHHHTKKGITAKEIEKVRADTFNVLKGLAGLW